MGGKGELAAAECEAPGEPRRRSAARSVALAVPEGDGQAGRGHAAAKPGGSNRGCCCGIPRGCWKMPACLACLANYGFSGWRCPCHSPLGAGAGRRRGRRGRRGRPTAAWSGGAARRGDPTTRRFGRAILSAVDSPVRQVRSVATQDVTTGQGVVVLKGSDHGSKLAAAKALQATEGSRVLLCTAAGQAGSRAGSRSMRGSLEGNGQQCSSPSQLFSHALTCAAVVMHHPIPCEPVPYQDTLMGMSVG